MLKWPLCCISVGTKQSYFVQTQTVTDVTVRKKKCIVDSILNVQKQINFELYLTTRKTVFLEAADKSSQCFSLLYSLSFASNRGSERCLLFFSVQPTSNAASQKKGKKPVVADLASLDVKLNYLMQPHANSERD